MIDPRLMQEKNPRYFEKYRILGTSIASIILIVLILMYINYREKKEKDSMNNFEEYISDSTNYLDEQFDINRVSADKIEIFNNVITFNEQKFEIFIASLEKITDDYQIFSKVKFPEILAGPIIFSIKSKKETFDRYFYDNAFFFINSYLEKKYSRTITNNYGIKINVSVAFSDKYYIVILAENKKIILHGFISIENLPTDEEISSIINLANLINIK